jgi:Concanavalin A-like lectin/glucanases superfamily
MAAWWRHRDVILRNTNINAALRDRGARRAAPRRAQRGFFALPGGMGAIRPSGGGTDPDFANVRLLLHMDGADASTTFTDHSSNGYTITAVGSAQIDTGISKYGGGAGQLGTTNYLTVTVGSWNIRTHSWCVEAWVYNNDTANFSLLSGGSGGDDFYCMLRTSRWYLGDGSVNVIDSGINASINANTWTHIAFTFDGTTYRLFRDGVLLHSSTSLLKNFGVTAMQIGRRASESLYVDRMDDFRLTVGAARYTANFTPPAAAHPNS